MKQPARNLLQRLGSVQSQIMSWRDMWVFVSQKEDNRKGRSWCEQLNKSPDFYSWGEAVSLQCRVPLSNIQGFQHFFLLNNSKLKNLKNKSLSSFPKLLDEYFK